MKTAVIGASGEIGARITQAMMQEGQQVRAISRKKSPRLARWGSIDFIAMEIPASQREMETALHGCDMVVNCVVDKKPFESEDASIKNNEQGLRTLIEASIKLGVRKFIHLSTIAVVPPRLTQKGVDNPFNYSKETDWYTRVKIATEKVALEFKDKINLCVLRPGIVYGPYLHWSRMGFYKPQNFNVVIPAVPDSVCHAIHVDDLAGLIRHLLKIEGRLPELLHGINPELVSWRDYYEKHGNALGLYDEIISELPEASIRTNHTAQKSLESGPGARERIFEQFRKAYRNLPSSFIQNPLSRKTVEVLKVLKRGLPFYTQLYLPPPKQSLFPNEFEVELYSTTGRFNSAMTGGEQGFTYRVPFSTGVKSSATWWNFEV